MLKMPVGPTIDHADYLGGSDIAAVVGLHPYKTALDVWCEKTGVVLPGEEHQRMRAGTFFERPILDFYASETGAKLVFPGTLRHPSKKWAAATPDAIDEDGRDIQVKMVGVQQSFRWGQADQGADGVPQELLPQVHWEALHMKLRLRVQASEALVIGQLGPEQRVYKVALDWEFTEALMEHAERFWRNNVMRKLMPIVNAGDMDTLKAIYKRSNRVLHPMEPRIVELARPYYELGQQMAALKTQRDALGVKLAQAVGDQGGFEGDDAKVTWFPQKGSISWKQCAESLGATEEIAEQYRGPDTRVLRVTFKEG